MTTRDSTPAKDRVDTTEPLYRGTGPRARHLHTDPACNALAGTEAVPVDPDVHDLPVCEHCTGTAALQNGSLAGALWQADSLEELREGEA